MILSKSLTLGIFLSLASVGSLALTGCGASPDTDVKYPEPIGESRGPMPPSDPPPVAQSPAPERAQEPAQQLEVRNAEVAGEEQMQAGAGGDTAIGTDDTGYVETDPAALTDFREPLAPYGSWVEDASYGTVWVPRTEVVGSDFAPYVSGGHWAYDDDYTWVSDYDWGWAPFHYGRWVWIGGRGWSWIPGRTYAGAWVVWRTGGPGYGYVGWAPAPPSWYWYGGYPVGVAYAHPVPYVFCGRADLFHPAVGGRIVTGPQVAQIGAATRPYTAASPSVAGTGRSVATPGVGGAGHVAGPNPSRELGITNAPHSPAGNMSLAKAQAYASPRTAVPMGAHPPSVAARQSASTPHAGSAVAGTTHTASAGFSGSQGNLPPRLRATASAPQYTGVSPSPYRQSTTIGRSDSGVSRGYSGSDSRAYSGSSSYSSSAGRSYSAPQQYHASQSTPSYSAAPHPSTPSVQSAPHSYSAAEAPHAAARGGGRGGGRGGHR